MAIHYNVPGKKRKELANEIGRWLGVEVKYLGAPGFAYKVGFATIDKDGNFTVENTADEETVERLIEHLYDEGFEEIPSEYEPTAVSITLPNTMTDGQIQNLRNLIKAKGSLIKKALGVEALPITVESERITFDWLPEFTDSDELEAIVHLITSMIELCKTQKKITVKEKDIENGKYAFRCFLLRLGFIGDKFKDERKILLRHFTGSSAFKEPKGVTDNV